MIEPLINKAEKLDEISQEIQVLDFKQQMVFCLLCCDRMHNSYKAFCQVYDSGNLEILSYLGLMWQNLENESRKNGEIQKQITHIKVELDSPYSKSPQLWDFLGKSYLKVLRLTFDLYQSKMIQTEILSEVSKELIQSLGLFVEIVTYPTAVNVGTEFGLEIREWASNSPMVSVEIFKQRSDLEKIIDSGKNLYGEIKQMREFNESFGINPFKLNIL